MDSKEINKAVKAAQELGDVQQENLRISRDTSNEIRDRLKVIKKENDLKKSTRSILNDIEKSASLQVDFAKEGVKSLLDSKKLNQALAASKAQQAKLAINTEDLKIKAALKLQDLESNLSSLTVKQLKDGEAQVNDALSLAEALNDQKLNLEASEASLESMSNAANQLDSLGSVSAFESLSQIAGAIPGVKSLTKGFDAAAEASKKAAASMVTINDDGIASSLTGLNKFQAGLKGLTAGADALMSAFGPLAILTKVFDGMMKADKSAGEIAKGLNISTKEAGKLSGEMLKASRTSDELGVTYKGQKHALMAINAELGTSTAISAKTLATFSKMENIAGMTQEEMMGIGKLSFATGKDMEKMTGEFLAQAKSASLKQGVLLNEKKLMADISKVSAATTLSLGKNPKAIANAVATAKALGMEMSQVNSIADSLLDFESSIEKEMEAELLLGRDLNLEKARTAALNNDLATVASEIAEQAGSAADFAVMNRLQQQALAEAVGMSREELAQTLFTQEQLKGLTEEEAIKAQEALDKRIEQVGLKQAQKEMEEGSLQNLFDQAAEQDKAALAAEAMNESFMEMGKSLMPVMELMTGLVVKASENVELIGAAVIGYGVINTLLLAQKLAKAAGNKEEIKSLLLGKSKLIQLAAQAVAYALANPIGALIGLAAAATVGAIAYAAVSKAGDVNSPANGKTQISTKEGGLFELSNNDDIVAAPGASAAMAAAASGGGGGNATAMKRLEELQAQTNSLLSRIASTQGTVTMDAEKMGTAVSMNTYEISP